MRKTERMLEVEERFGEPIEGLLIRMHHEDKKSCREIGITFGVDKETTRKWMKILGIPIYNYQNKCRKSGRPSCEKLRELYWDEKLSLIEMSGEYGVSCSTIGRWLDYYSIDRRSISESRGVEYNKRGGISRNMLRIEEERGMTIKEILQELYWERCMNGSKVGEVLGVCSSTIIRWMKKQGVNRRKHTYSPIGRTYSEKEVIDIFMEVRTGKREFLPMEFWSGKGGKVRARIVVKYVLEKELKINVDDIPKKISKKVMDECGLSGLISHCTKRIYDTMENAYPGKFKVWQFNHGVKWSTNRDGKKIAKEAVRWMVEERMKIPIEEIPTRVDTKTFKENGLWGMLQHAFSASYINALVETYPSRFSREDFKLLWGTTGYEYESDHGHLFKSKAECKFDNMLWDLGITNHTHNVRYPYKGYMNCDVVIGNGKYWVEFAGLKGVKKYDKHIDKKREIAMRNGLNWIMIKYKDDERVIMQKLAPVIREFGNGITLNNWLV